MLNTLIVGATGYAGAELAAYLSRHPHMNITGLTVSAQSTDAGKMLSDLHPQLKGIVDLPVLAMTNVQEAAKGVDVVFLATAHEVSHDLAPQFLAAEIPLTSSVTTRTRGSAAIVCLSVSPFALCGRLSTTTISYSG